MKIGVDLDGTLDRPAILEMVKYFLAQGQEVHIVSGAFPDAEWQNRQAKMNKLVRMGLATEAEPFTYELVPGLTLHVIIALPVGPNKNLDYVLRDLGMRKGTYCEMSGITLFFDDSQTYCDMISRVSGTLALRVP